MTFPLRFYPAALQAKQMIDDGFIGEPIGFRGSFLHSGNVDPECPMGRKQIAHEEGGTLRDLGSHLIDLVDWPRGYPHCPYAFLTAVAAGKQGEPSLRRGVRLERMMAAVAASAKSRCRVNL